MASALEDIVILDLTDGMAGAIASMLLCDNGARVIRLEYEGSELKRQAPSYAVWDRGKESVFFDLGKALSGQQDVRHSTERFSETPSNVDVFRQFQRLVADCDVLIESFAPSSRFQALVEYQRLVAINPGLVHCSITAYGRKGPLRDEDAVDDLVMSRLGILATQPSFRPGPVHVIHPLPSVGAGILAAQGAVASLYAKEKSGVGQKVDTSLMAAALLFTPKVGGEDIRATFSGRATVGGGPFYSAFECLDGDWIQLACIHRGFVAKAASAMNIADVLADPKFGDCRNNIPTEEARAELSAIVEKVIRTRTYEEWEVVFEMADVPYAKACSVSEAMEDPQALINEMVIDVDDPRLGLMTQMGLALKFSRTPGNVRSHRPIPGHHTEEVLSRLAEHGPSVVDGLDLHSIPVTQPLAGVKVLEAANVIAGPTAGKLLSDLGADVIKLEPPSGDISRQATGKTPYFFFLNSNKKSVAIDARTDDGKDVAAKLASAVDIFVANMRPGATDRIGIGTETLSKLNPALIEVHVTGFGWAGPYSHRAGLDPLAQALMGLQRAQGGLENPPVYLYELAPTDYVAGALAALGSILALFVRERTGLSQRIDTNLLNSAIFISSGDFVRYIGSPRGRFADREQYGLNYLHRLYETANGWIYLAAEDQNHRTSLLTAIGCDDLVAGQGCPPDDVSNENEAALETELSRRFGEHTSEHWLRVFGEVDVPSAPVIDGYLEGFFSDPQAIANDMMVEVEHPVLGTLKLAKNLVRFQGVPDIDVLHTPLLGQHNREILEQVGYSPVEIENLYRNGVAKTE